MHDVTQCHGNYCYRTCKRLGTKFKMADVCEKDTSLASFVLKTLCFFKFP